MSTLVKGFKGIWKVLKVIVGLFIGFIIFGSCCAICVDNGITMETITETTTVTVVEKYNIQNVQAYSDYGIMTITGTLVADKDYEYLQLEIPCYDSEGNNVGSALANVNNLSKGDSWKFEAIELSGNGTKYNINKAEVTGF